MRAAADSGSGSDDDAADDDGDEDEDGDEDDDLSDSTVRAAGRAPESAGGGARGRQR